MLHKILTKKELDAIEKRVTEISQIMEICDPIKDDDVIQNLDFELAEINSVLLESLKETRIQNRSRRV